jgi:hypothetical protein
MLCVIIIPRLVSGSVEQDTEREGINDEASHCNIRWNKQ